MQVTARELLSLQKGIMVSWYFRFAADRKTHLALCAICVALSGCAKAMHQDGRVKPFEKVDFFPHQQSERQPVPGTIARSQTNDSFHTGRSNGNFVADLPIALNKETLLRGQERYDIYCAPCHDRTGSGRGRIVERGFKPSVPFSDERLRRAPAGYFFDAISHGYKTMYPMAAQVPTEERWEIIAYIRALQLSQHASLEQLPSQIKDRLPAQ